MFCRPAERENYSLSHSPLGLPWQFFKSQQRNSLSHLALLPCTTFFVILSLIYIIFSLSLSPLPLERESRFFAPALLLGLFFERGASSLENASKIFPLIIFGPCVLVYIVLNSKNRDGGTKDREGAQKRWRQFNYLQKYKSCFLFFHKILCKINFLIKKTNSSKYWQYIILNAKKGRNDQVSSWDQVFRWERKGV